MADRVLPGPVDQTAGINEAVCIHTNKVYDSCRDKDCVEDLRVYPTCSSQAIIDSAFSIRPRSAQLLYADINVDEISFNRGYYTVDVTYFYRVVGESFPGGCEVRGLAVFDKRVVLFGSEGSVRVFTSDGNTLSAAEQPIAVVEAVDPIALNMKLADAPIACGDQELREVPQAILDAMGEDLILNPTGRILYATLGQFSIIRLERDTRIVIPVYNYCFPDKECVGSSEDDPCTLFSRIPFPVEEFFPPDDIAPTTEDYRTVLQNTQTGE